MSAKIKIQEVTTEIAVTRILPARRFVFEITDAELAREFRAYFASKLPPGIIIPEDIDIEVNPIITGHGDCDFDGLTFEVTIPSGEVG